MIERRRIYGYLASRTPRDENRYLLFDVNGLLEHADLRAEIGPGFRSIVGRVEDSLPAAVVSAERSLEVAVAVRSYLRGSALQFGHAIHGAERAYGKSARHQPFFLFCAVLDDLQHAGIRMHRRMFRSRAHRRDADFLDLDGHHVAVLREFGGSGRIGKGSSDAVI